MPFSLRSYQKQIVDNSISIISQYNFVYLCLAMRSGKNIISLAIANELSKHVKKSVYVLFITKVKAKNGLRSDFKLTGYSNNIKLKITNYESLHKSIKYKDKFDIVIVDESHNLGAFPTPSKRAELCKQFCSIDTVKVIYLTGSPVTESFLQLYHQFYILGDRNPFRFNSFEEFSKEYCNTIFSKSSSSLIYTPNKKFSNKLDEIKSKYFQIRTQIENGFVRQAIDKIIKVTPTQELEKHISRMSNGGEIYYKGNIIKSVTRADKKMKTLQLCSGCIRHTINEDNVKYLTIDPFKAEYILNNFKGRKKAIIYSYEAEGRLLKRYFPNWTSDQDIFQSGSDKVYIGQVKSCKEGVTLDTADALIFFSISPSGADYIQARERSMSKDRVNDCFVYWIFCDSDQSIEEQVYDKTIKEKKKLLDYFYKK